MEQQTGLEETTESENPLYTGNNGRNSRKLGEVSTDRNERETLKPEMTSGQSKGDFMYRHHIEPRVQLHVPKEETRPIPLKYVDVTRTMHTNLDVLQESRIDDYWNVDVDVDRHLSDSWTGFTKFTLLNEKLPPGYMWSG